MPEQTESASRGWSERWSPLGGLAFAIGLILLFILDPGDTGETPEEVIAFADDEEAGLIRLLVFALVSIPLLLWFVSGLYARVRRLQSQTAPALVLAGGTAFALFFFLAFTIWSAPLLDFPGEADATAAANAYLLIDDIGWVVLGGAGVAFALMAVAASVTALRSGVVPTWLGWLGAIAGLAAAATIAFVGIFAWIAWILVASLLLLVRRA
jgi:hypothetical protein